MISAFGASLEKPSLEKEMENFNHILDLYFYIFHVYL